MHLRFRLAHASLCTLAWLTACASSHATDSDDLGGITLDAEMTDGHTSPDMGAGDGGQPVFCQTDYSLSGLGVPSLESGIGFNLDGGGSEIGCSDDGPGGVDNGVVDLDDLLDGLGFSVNEILGLASSLGVLRLALRIDECEGASTIQLVSADGVPMGEATPLTVASDGSFSAMLDELPIMFPLIIAPGTLDFTMEDVTLTGVIGDGQLDDLVMGGAIEGELVRELGQMIGPLLGIDQMLVDNVLRNILDLDTDPMMVGCEYLSMQLTASARATAFQTAP